MAQVRLALGIRRRASRRVHFAREPGLHGGHDVLEHVAFGDDLGARVGLEGVAGVGVEVVVDCVQEGVASDFGGATRGVVDVVLLEGDHVVGAGEVQSPCVSGRVSEMFSG